MMDKKKQDPELKAFHEAVNAEVPQDLEKKLDKRLEAFREDLREHPYVTKENRPGLFEWPRISTRSMSWLRSFALVGTAIICIVLGVYFFVGNTTPTWAEVTQSFASYPYHSATIYFRKTASSETKSIEFWAGRGYRIRVLEGKQITFARKGVPPKTFDLETRQECNPGKGAKKVLKNLGFLEHWGLKSETHLMDAFFSGRINDFANKVNVGSRISKDIVVFESTPDQGQYGRSKTQILVLRNSKLPIRFTSHRPGGMRMDVVFSYFREPSESFFDPEAFAAKLKDPANSAFTLMYMGLKDLVEKSVLSPGS